MSNAIIGDKAWKLLTEVQKTEVVHRGDATLRQLTQGLLDGPVELRSACRDALIHTGTGLEELRRSTEPESPARHPKKTTRKKAQSLKSKSGLPGNFRPMAQRGGRRLLPDNIYRLSDGREFVPVNPSGALGGLAHQYALLTVEQYQQGGRGSIYIRVDGRIFDYSQLGSDPLMDLFDTGFTIVDLERTGGYATQVEPKGKRKSRASGV